MIKERRPILTERWRSERTREAWAEEQLARVCVDIVAPEGGPSPRHNRLYKAACRMGAYVDEGVIDYDVVRTYLTAAARVAGLDGSRAGEVYRTIRDGCQRGANDLAWYPPSVIPPVEFAVRDGLIRGMQDRRRRDYHDRIRQHRARNGGHQ